jgi:hypothetical protein
MKEILKFDYSQSELPHKYDGSELTPDQKQLIDNFSIDIKQDLQKYLDSFQEKFYLNYLHPKKDYVLASVAQELNLEYSVITGVDISKFNQKDIQLIDHMASGLHDQLLKKDKLDALTNYADKDTQDKIVKSTLIQVLKDLGHQIQ